MSEPVRRRGAGTIVIAVILVLLCVNAIIQAIGTLIGWNNDPPLLTAFQFAAGGSALCAAVGTWRRERWAPAMAVAYGIITGIMIASLGPLLELDEQARAGLPLGAAIVVLIGGALAWGIRRTQRTTSG